MTKIRSSEEKLRNLQVHSSSRIESIEPSQLFSSVSSASIQEKKYRIQDYSDVIEEEPTTEVLELVQNSVTDDSTQIQKLPARKVFQQNKRKCIEKGSDLTFSFVYTHYELEKESGQNVISLAISQKQLDLSEKDVEYISFDLSYMNHADDNFMYKCNFCVKAFSTSELLVKHTIISHLCVLCHKVFANYKELNMHVKNDPEKNLLCKFCDNNFDHSSYRHHLKVKHKLTLPIHIGIT